MGSQPLLGVAVELAEGPFDIAEPIFDRPLPGGRARLAAARDRAVLHVQGVGSFAIEHGNRIRLAPENGAAPDAAARWLNGTVATLLLAQRGQFALHASVAEIDGAAVALCGPRRAGKSTTALRLAQRGHPLVTDDVSVLAPGDPVMVHPLVHPVRVLPETAERLGLDTSEAKQGPRQLKLVLPAPSRPPLPLAAIALLRRDGSHDVSAVRLRGADAHWVVGSNTHRGGIFRLLWEAEIFTWAARVSSAVPVHAISRPGEGWTVDAVADAVEKLTTHVR
jgi:hypothetical protein